jgi:hypothetical protein
MQLCFEMFAIRFETPQHGWLPIELLVADQRLMFHASDVAPNFLEGLVVALDAFLDGQVSTVEIFEEPALHELTFTTKSGKGLLQIKLDGVLTPIEFEEPKVEIALTCWRALRELEGRVEQKAFDEHWLGFPNKQVAALGQKIKKLQHID